MALRDSWLVRVLAGCLVGMSLLAALLGVWVTVRTGHWLDACVTPQMVVTFCGSAFVSVIVLVVIGVVLAATWIFRRVRGRRESSLGGSTDA
jgi:ABC-type dipeptide/oligopeptide/nickel transport system permease component